MTEVELKNLIQYWESQYSNCDSRSDRELYLKVYTSLRDVLDLWMRRNMFAKE